MPKINYEFDRGQLPPSPEKSGVRKWRLPVIFLVIAAITGAGIYFLRPKKTAQQQSAEVPLPPETAALPPLPLEIPDDPPGKTEAESAVVTALPVLEAVSEPEKTPAPPRSIAEPEIEPEYTAEPEKDRPWIGDLRVSDGELPAGPIPESALAPFKAKLAAGEFEAVRDGILELFAAGTYAENSAPWREAAQLLTEADFQMLENGTVPRRGAVVHTVKSGDLLEPLARRNRVPVDEIMTYSKLKSANTIRVGQKLRIYPGPWRIRVEKSARLLKLYNENPAFPHLFAAWDTGIGRQNLTPSAGFVISARLKNPVYYAPDGRVYPFGDPENVLGTRFLKLAQPGTPDKPLMGYGIHGTTREESVTRAESAGCIRMRNRDVERLFLVVPAGTPVEIVD